jgi:hypothetical protein
MDPAQLKAQYDQTQYLSNEHSNIQRDMLKGFDLTQLEFLKSQNAQTKEVLDSAERAGYAAENRQNNGFTRINEVVHDKTAGLAETVYKTAADTTAWINKNGSDNLAATERVGGGIDTNLYRVAGQLDNSIYRSAMDNKQGITDGHNYLSQQGYRIAQQQQDLQARDQNELINYFRMNSDQSWNNFSKVNDKINENTAAIQIDALKNKADLSKQSAFEYSSLKQSIADSEGSIKDLLRAQEADRLRDALRSTEHKSLYFELRDRHHRHHRH